MSPILTAAQQEARLLKDELTALDEHDAETRRLLDDHMFRPPGEWEGWAARSTTRQDLSARVVERSRRLAKLVAP